MALPRKRCPLRSLWATFRLFVPSEKSPPFASDDIETILRAARVAALASRRFTYVAMSGLVVLDPLSVVNASSYRRLDSNSRLAGGSYAPS